MRTFDSDLAAGKGMEYKALEVIKDYGWTGTVTTGEKPHDLELHKGNSNATAEVKYHTCPEKFLVYEVYNFYQMRLTCLGASEATFWVDVITEVNDGNKKTVWIANRKALKAHINNLYKTYYKDTKRIRTCTGAGRDKHSVGINVLISDIKSFSKYIGDIKED